MITSEASNLGLEYPVAELGPGKDSVAVIGFENIDHYFTSVRDECNCEIV